MKILTPLLLLLLSLSGLIHAQDDYTVTQLTFLESLSFDDEQEKGFGRFDAFEFEADEGDRVRIDVEANLFDPTLLLISPDDSTFVFPTRTGQRAVSHDLILPMGGVWLLVVRGDSLALGPYEVRCRRAALNSLTVDESADICEQLHFLAAHANADFVFVEDKSHSVAAGENHRPNIVVENALQAELVEEAEDFVLA